MAKSSRRKNKVAGPRKRGKRSGKAKDLTARGRGTAGGVINLTSSPQTTQSFGGIVLRKDQALNLGL